MEIAKQEKKATLKSTGIVALSQIGVIILGILKIKVFAVLLGPSGVGLLGLYQSTIDLIRNFSGFGINFSAVREISHSKEKKSQLLETWGIVSKWMVFASVFGVALTSLLSKEISKLIFDTGEYYLEFIFLSITIPLGIWYSGKISYLQGVRNIKLLAKSQLISAAFATMAAVMIIIMWKEEGIVLSIISFWIVQFLTVTWLSRKIILPPKKVSNQDALKAGKGMVKLGALTVLASLSSALTLYFIRIFISNKSGVADVGLFQAGITLSTVYLMTILQAMSADYYPKLSSFQNNKDKMTKLANEQLEIVVNIASILIISMLIFLPVLIEVFYSEEFTKAAPMIEWLIAGSFFRIVGYPLSYLLLAAGKGKSYVIVEFIFNSIYLLTTYFLWKDWSLEAVGIGLTVGYIGYFFGNLYFSARFGGFKIYRSNIQTLLIYLFLIISTCLSIRFVSFSLINYSIQALILLIAVTLSFKYLNSIFEIRRFIKNLLH